MKNKKKQTNFWSEFELSLPQRFFAQVAILLVAITFALGFVHRAGHLINILDIDFVSLSENKEPENELISTTTQVLFLGDIMLDRGVLGKINKAKAGYGYPFEYVTDRFGEYDLVVANLEGPTSDRGTLVGSKYSFRFSPQITSSLSEAGVGLVSLANNHIWDYGRKALCDSVDLMGEAGIATVGAGCNEEVANRPALLSVNNQDFLFMGYTNLYPDGLVSRGDIPGISDFSVERIAGIVDSYREQHPELLVVLLAHWGDEYETRSHTREQKLARDLIDVGVDVIVGHHPHVTQEIERYKDGWIFYSLGNFIFDQYFSEETMRGFAVSVSSHRGKVLDFDVLPYEINSNYQPIFLDQEN